MNRMDVERASSDKLLGEHAEAMDQAYEWQRHIYDVTRRWFLLGRDMAITDLAPPVGGSVLEVGCGTARNLIAVARRHPHCRLLGFDISSAMLETAQASVVRSGYAPRIELALGDACDFDTDALFGVEHVDRILISYAVSMIPGWERALECAARRLAPGGEVHVVDFGTLSGLPGVTRRALEAWLARFSVTPRKDLEQVIASTAATHGLEPTYSHPLRTYVGYGVMRRPNRELL